MSYRQVLICDGCGVEAASSNSFDAPRDWGANVQANGRRLGDFCGACWYRMMREAGAAGRKAVVGSELPVTPMSATAARLIRRQRPCTGCGMTLGACTARPPEGPCCDACSHTHSGEAD